MASSRMQHLIDMSAEQQSNEAAKRDGKRCGAYVRAAFHSCGWAFKTAAEAAEYVEQQKRNAERDGMRGNFSAAATDEDGRPFLLYS